MNLRPYQTQAISDICTAWQTNDRVIYQGATGSGKTEIAKQIILNSNVKSLFVVHRKELLAQNQTVFADVPNVDIAMVQTLARRKLNLEEYELIIIDEAHHATSKSYEFSLKNHARILGLTATPRRLDGKPLGNRFDILVQGPSIQELIKDGYLAIPEIYVPPKTAGLVAEHEGEWKVTAGDYNQKSVQQFFEDNQKYIFGDVIDHFRQLVVDKPTIIFCPSVKSVYETVQLFHDNGISAVGIDGALSSDERKQIVGKWESGQEQCLVSCDLVSEGFDAPDAYAAIMLRPTKSLTVYLQQAGRVLRMKDDKHKCIIIDHVNNTSHFGPPWLQRYWSLDGYTKRTKTDTLSGLNLKLCLKCGNYVANNCMICPICGNPFKQKSKAFKVIYEDLQKITIESAQELIEQTVQKILNKEKYKMAILKTKEDFLNHAIKNKYSNPEAWADKAHATKLVDDKVFFEGTRDELIVLGAKRKKSDPAKWADETLAKRAEYNKDGKQRKVVAVFESGTMDEIIEYVKREKPEINNPEAYAQGVMRKRLAPILESGTDEQKAEAQKLVTPVSRLSDPAKDRYTSMFEFAKSGKLTPRDENAPRAYTDEEADKFAKAVVRKDNKSVIDSGDKSALVSVAEQMHIPAERREAWASTVLSGRK